MLYERRPPFPPSHPQEPTYNRCMCVYVCLCVCAGVCVWVYVMYQYQYRRHFILFVTKFAHLQKPLKSFSSNGKKRAKIIVGGASFPLFSLYLSLSLARTLQLPGILFAWWKISFRMLYRFISHTHTHTRVGCLQIVCILSALTVCTKSRAFFVDVPTRYLPASGGTRRGGRGSY